MKRILATTAALLAAGSITLAAVRARASVPGQFAVVDNGGVYVTAQPLIPGQDIYSGGHAYEVTGVKDYAGVYEFGLVPGLPASDLGKEVTFSA